MIPAQFIAASLLWPLASVAAMQQTVPPVAETGVIRMDVHLVVLHATVTDQNGNPIFGLGQQAFQLFVDDKPQPITKFQGEDAPVAVGIVVDQSSSMTALSSSVIAAAVAFAEVSNPDDQMFVVDFSDTARLGLPPDKSFTSSTSELSAALSRFAPAGATALYDALGMALAHIEKATIARRVLLVISDGGDNSSHVSLPAIASWTQKAGVAVYAVGIFDEKSSDRNPQLLTQLAEATGGKAFFPSTIEEIKQTCITFAKHIRNQYTLGFSGAEDGQYHRIRLTAKDSARGDLTVHTRPGYLAER